VRRCEPPAHQWQGVRGSNPLSSTPGQRPSSASTAPEPPASGSKSAAICVARPIGSADAAWSVAVVVRVASGGPQPVGAPLRPSVAPAPGLLPGLGRRHQLHPPGQASVVASSSPLAPVSTVQPMQSRGDSHMSLVDDLSEQALRWPARKATTRWWLSWSGSPAATGSPTSSVASTARRAAPTRPRRIGADPGMPRDQSSRNGRMKS
jgi:hypothetical protein